MKSFWGWQMEMGGGRKNDKNIKEALSIEEKENRKKVIFDSMGKRGQERIVRIGYEKWDPFEEPKDPINLRENKSKRTTQALIREFLQNLKSENYSNDFAKGAFDMCLGVINEDDKYLGMFEFACWYKKLLEGEVDTSNDE